MHNREITGKDDQSSRLVVNNVHNLVVEPREHSVSS